MCKNSCVYKLNIVILYVIRQGHKRYYDNTHYANAIYDLVLNGEKNS